MRRTPIRPPTGTASAVGTGLTARRCRTPFWRRRRQVSFGSPGLARGKHVLDIGCGCGTTTLQIASRIGPQGSAIGIDVSAPMLARARELTPPGAPVRFVEADATIYDFEPGRADLIFSRFGVMFFGEPERSFANMRKGLRAGGRLVFACWREPRFNPWMMTPLQAVYRHAPRLPEVGPEDPGAFSFANRGPGRAHTECCGFLRRSQCIRSISSSTSPWAWDWTPRSKASLEIGPASRALEGQPAETVSAAAGAVRTALAEHLKGRIRADRLRRSGS